MMGQNWATEIKAWTSGKFPYQCFDSWGKFPKIYLFSVYWKLISYLATEVGVEKTEFWNSSSYLLLLSWKSYNSETNFYKKQNKQNTHTHWQKLGFQFDVFTLVNSLSKFFACLRLYVTFLDFLFHLVIYSILQQVGRKYFH